MRSHRLIGSSPGFRAVLDQVRMVAPVDCTVLLHGETGTGKEAIARAICAGSARRDRPFVALNCAALPAALLESELFGHEKGAFTGACTQTVGRFQAANRGTLFLDEIGELPLELQPKLLRVLQEKEFERIGSNRTLRADVRMIAATNQNLGKMVRERRFRADLFYRLNVFPIEIPPLRERKEDIPALLEHYVRQFAERYDRLICTVPEKLLARLKSYAWPGNIRELQNFAERSVILSSGPVLHSLAEELPPSRDILAPTLPDTERSAIIAALRDAKGVIGGWNGAARRLGLRRTTLLARMKKLGIARSDLEDAKVPVGAPHDPAECFDPDMMIGNPVLAYSQFESRMSASPGFTEQHRLPNLAS